MRCKNCKEKFEPYEFNGKYCKSIDCQTARAMSLLQKKKAKDKKEWNNRKRKIKKDLETVQDLMKKAQKEFNTFIRLRDQGKKCISCDTILKGKFDAGHYFSSGGHKNITFNEDNVHGQCVHCNQHKHGNLIAYQIGIQERIGGERLIKLHELAHLEYKPTRSELRSLITEYKQKAKNKDEHTETH